MSADALRAAIARVRDAAKDRALVGPYLGADMLQVCDAAAERAATPVALTFTLREARELVEAFGGDGGCEMSVRQFDAGAIKDDPSDPVGEDSPAGLWCYATDYPEEGAIYLGPVDPDAAPPAPASEPHTHAPGDIICRQCDYEQSNASEPQAVQPRNDWDDCPLCGDAKCKCGQRIAAWAATDEGKAAIEQAIKEGQAAADELAASRRVDPTILNIPIGASEPQPEPRCAYPSCTCDGPGPDGGCGKAEPPADALVERHRGELYENAPAALVERLQGWATQPNAVSQDLRRDLAQAADRIAALTAERDAARASARDMNRVADHWVDTLQRAESALAAANERAEGLRRALRSIADAKPSEWEADVRDQFQPWAQNIAARAVLEGKS